MGIWGGSSFFNYSAPHYNLRPNDPTLTESLQNSKKIAELESSQMLPGEFNLLDSIGNLFDYLTVVCLLILLIDTLFGKKQPIVFEKFVGLVFLLLLRNYFPILSIVNLLLVAPSTFKATKHWFKSNVNKRSELETELRLINQA